jgi:hypothetical protein
LCGWIVGSQAPAVKLGAPTIISSASPAIDAAAGRSAATAQQGIVDRQTPIATG